MIWIWNFILYSFVGFLLEVAFARATGGRRDRKCLLVLPLCPVYGLGACLILLLPQGLVRSPMTLFLLGGLAATAAEYGMALVYEKWLGVSFWDYTGLPGSVKGRVCLPFTLAWGALALALVAWVQPAVVRFAAVVPGQVTWMAAATVAADMAVSAVMMRRTGGRDCLRWYRREEAGERDGG